jgi:hypothetical protein
MKRIVGLLSIIILLFPVLINAQGYAAIPALGLNPDPQSFGLGMSGVSLPSNDPTGFYFNPAMLGYSSQTKNLSIQFYTDKVIWLPGRISSGTTFNNIGITAGYNFENILNGLNLSAGLGFISNKFDYGWSYAYDQSSRTNIYYDAFDKYNAFGIGVSLNYYINLSLGLTFKAIDSKIGPFANEEIMPNAVDWGVLLNVPVSKLVADDLIYKPFENTFLKPVVNLSMGYSRSNIGNEVSYIDPAQKDPLPLTARLGYTISLGSDLLVNNHSINFFTYDITIESEDLLINPIPGVGFSYQGLLGNLKPWENLIEWKQTTKMTLRKAQKFSLFETISFLNGSYYNSSPGDNWTNGIMVSTNGIFKLLSWNFYDNQYVKFFLDHFEIQYVKASWISNPINFSASNYYPTNLKTDMQAVSISFNRFAF